MPRVRPPPLALSAAARIQFMWLASPALPVGGFSYSEGLEAAIDAGLVTDEAQCAAWLHDQLRLALARSELPVVTRAVRAWHREDWTHIEELNQWVLQTRETQELRLQSEQMGRSLVEWLRNLMLPASSQDVGPDTHARSLARLQQCSTLSPAPSWPIAFALCVAQAAPGPSHRWAHPSASAWAHEGLLSFAFAWAENMVQAAIKAVPLGQYAGQRILHRLAAAIPETIDRAMSLPESERRSFMPRLAILSARHESQYSRLFRS